MGHQSHYNAWVSFVIIGLVNSLRPEQNGCCFADNIFKLEQNGHCFGHIFKLSLFNENFCILIPINLFPRVQLTISLDKAWLHTGNAALSEPTLW